MRTNLSILLFVLFAALASANEVYLESLRQSKGSLIIPNLKSDYWRSAPTEADKRLKVVSGNVTLLEDLTNEHTVTVNISSIYKDEPLYRGLVTVQKTPICDTFAKFYAPYINTTLQTGENTNFVLKEKLCPLPKGTYWAKDVRVLLEKWNRDWFFEPSEYNASLTVFDKNGKFGGSVDITFYVKEY